MVGLLESRAVVDWMELHIVTWDVGSKNVGGADRAG